MFVIPDSKSLAKDLHFRPKQLKNHIKSQIFLAHMTGLVLDVQKSPAVPPFWPGHALALAELSTRRDSWRFWFLQLILTWPRIPWSGTHMKYSTIYIHYYMFYNPLNEAFDWFWWYFSWHSYFVGDIDSFSMFPPKKGEMKLASLKILRLFHLDSPWHDVTALRRPGKTVEEVCSTLGEDYWWWRWCRIQIPSTSSIKSGQIIATSAEVTPNGGDCKGIPLKCT